THAKPPNPITAKSTRIRSKPDAFISPPPGARRRYPTRALTPEPRSGILRTLLGGPMSPLRRIVLLRHGNTVATSRERSPGSGDVALADEGREQMRRAARALSTEVFDLVAASPLRRAWQSAALISGGAHVLLVPEFREIDFGRWEGLTA